MIEEENHKRGIEENFPQIRLKNVQNPTLLSTAITL
jgi:hypothetical protein